MPFLSCIVDDKDGTRNKTLKLSEIHSDLFDADSSDEDVNPTQNSDDENDEKMASDEETPMDEEDEEPVEMSAALKKRLAQVCYEGLGF